MNQLATATQVPISSSRIKDANRSGHHRNRSKDERVAELQRLYRRVLERYPDDNYMKDHSQINSIRRQVDAFQLYNSFLPEEGVVLDWGCRHAADSCLIRHELGDNVSLLGYDFDRGDTFHEFHEYANVDFTCAEHVYNLPYADESVDVVVASGVLEHAALPSESLKELYRVMKVGGILVVSFLPNRWSYTEFIHRRKGRGHRRLYSKRLASQLLLHHGFDPQKVGFHQFFPAQRGAQIFAPLWGLNSLLERCWPFRMFSANLYLIAIKRLAMKS